MSSLQSKRQKFRKVIRKNQIQQIFKKKRIELVNQNQNTNFINDQPRQSQLEMQKQLLGNLNRNALDQLNLLLSLAHQNSKKSNYYYALIGNLLIDNNDLSNVVEKKIFPLSNVSLKQFFVQIQDQQKGIQLIKKSSFPKLKSWVLFLVFQFLDAKRQSQLFLQYDQSIARMLLDDRLQVVFLGINMFQSFFFSNQVVFNKQIPKNQLHSYIAFKKLLSKFTFQKDGADKYFYEYILINIFIILQRVYEEKTQLFESLIGYETNQNISMFLYHLLEYPDFRNNALNFIYNVSKSSIKKINFSPALLRFLVNLSQITTLQNKQYISQIITLHIMKFDTRQICFLLNNGLISQLIQQIKSNHRQLQFMGLKIIKQILQKMQSQQNTKQTNKFLIELQRQGFRQLIQYLYNSINCKEDQEYMQICEWIVDNCYASEDDEFQY